jgi:hypothetical protein
LKKRIFDACLDKCSAVAAMGLADKYKRAELFSDVKKEFVATLTEEEVKEFGGLVGTYFHSCEKEAVRSVMLTKKYVSMVARWMRFVLSGQRLIICQVHTGRLFSLEEKLNHSLPLH